MDKLTKAIEAALDLCDEGTPGAIPHLLQDALTQAEHYRDHPADE